MAARLQDVDSTSNTNPIHGLDAVPLLPLNDALSACMQNDGELAAAMAGGLDTCKIFAHMHAEDVHTAHAAAEAHSGGSGGGEGGGAAAAAHAPIAAGVCVCVVCVCFFSVEYVCMLSLPPISPTHAMKSQ